MQGSPQQIVVLLHFRTQKLNRVVPPIIPFAMLALTSLPSLAYTTRPFIPKGVEPSWDPKPWSTSEINDAAGLKELAIKQNPVVGYWGVSLTSRLIEAIHPHAAPPCLHPHMVRT
jgi:hypothetical protein